jgi:hypothetical protein
MVSMQFNRLASNIKNVATKVGSLGDKFKRILLYRGIRTLIREITQSFGEGIKNLYGWSQIADGRFAASMDRISTSFLYFKNSIGAAVAPLINALAPAIDFVIDKVVALLNMINQLFAKLTGATYWTKANKVAKQYADNASAAGGAAKEAMRYLAPFDELNRLPSDSGGGGGGGSSGTDYSDMFEIQNEFSENIANFAEMIKAAWESGDWEDVGRFIGGKVNDLVDRIDWAGIGTKVGKSINALFSVQYWTLDEINFTNLGGRIAEFLNNAIANINWDIAGRLPVKQLTSIIDTVIGFLGGLDWGQIGRSITSYISGALSEATDWLNNTDFAALTQNFIDDLTELFRNVDWGKLARDILSFLGAALKASNDVLKTILDNVMDGIFDALFGDDVWAKTKNWFINGWNGIIDSIKQNTTVMNIFDFFGIDPDSLKFEPIEIEAKANLTSVTDSIPDSQRLLGMGGNLTYWQRGWGSSSGYNYIDLPANLSSWKRGWGSGSTYNYMNVTANLTGWQRYSSWYSKGWNLLSLTGYLTGWKQANGVAYYGSLILRQNARGGAFYGGSWHDIPQYASGTLNAGSMFIAGEAGPELVGHIGGRTEVLNASQIASAIAAGVAGATYSYDAQGMSEEMLYNAFVRALNDSDIGGDTYLDGEVLYRSVRKHNDMNTRMTGVNAFA